MRAMCPGEDDRRRMAGQGQTPWGGSTWAESCSVGGPRQGEVWWGLTRQRRPEARAAAFPFFVSCDSLRARSEHRRTEPSILREALLQWESDPGAGFWQTPRVWCQWGHCLWPSHYPETACEGAVKLRALQAWWWGNPGTDSTPTQERPLRTKTFLGSILLCFS